MRGWLCFSNFLIKWRVDCDSYKIKIYEEDLEKRKNEYRSKVHGFCVLRDAELESRLVG